MKRWIGALALVVVVVVLAAPGVDARQIVQPTKAGVLFTSTTLTDAGPTAGTRFISASGWRQCVFQCLITAGTVTVFQLQQRIKGASGANQWTNVAGATCNADGAKFTVTSPLGEYALLQTGANGLSSNVIYECDKVVIQQ